MQRAAATALASFLALCAAAPGSANWSPNGVVALSDPSHPIGDAHLATDGTGEVFVWGNFYAGGAGPNIYARLLNPDGSLGAGLGLSASDQTCGIPDGTGGFFHAVDYRDIALFRYQHAGGPAPGWSGGMWVATTTADESFAQVVPDGAGGAVVAYVENQPPPRIKVKHVLASGALDASWPATGRILNNGASTPGSTSPLAISDGGGGACVVWQSLVPYVQHVMSNGAIDPLWPPGGLPLSGALASGPLLALFSSGPSSFIVAWNSGSDVVIQRFALDGTVDGSWPSDGIVIPAGSTPLVIADASNGALVAWQNGTSLLAARVQSDGTFLPDWPASGRALLGTANFASTSSYTAVATGPAGGIVVCWNDDRRPGHTLVRARWLLANGDADPSQPDSGLVASPAATNATVRSVISDGAGGVYVAWIDSAWPSNLNNDLKVTWLPYPSGNVGVPHAHAAEFSLAAFPNPARGEVSVRCALASAAPARLQLIDLAGRVVREREIRGVGERVEHIGDAGGLAPGVYLVRLAQQGKFRTTRVAIVR